jgi:N-acetylmuramoyl-L-alanine amidase
MDTVERTSELDVTEAPLGKASLTWGPGAAGEDVVSLARAHIGERYDYGVFVPKDNAGWRGPWDCAEFIAWLYYQSARSLYGCSNTTDPRTADAYSGYFRDQSLQVGIRVSLDQAMRTPGCVLLRSPGTGVSGHVALSDGKGGTLEAYSTERGVIASTAGGRRWDCGVQVPGVRYHLGPALPAAKAPVLVVHLTEPAMQGDAVRAIQSALAQRGFHPGDIDGVFGQMTSAAVAAYQRSAGLLCDGEVGPETAARLGV